MSKQIRRPNTINTIDQTMTAAKNKGIIQLSTEDTTFNGTHITTNGKSILNFGSCSYLGLELHPDLKAGVIDAVNRFGSQYSSSRAYMSSGQYDELEDLLSKIFNGHAVVTATTTLGHISSLPVIIGENDAVILDQQVHASVQTAAQLLKPKGITVELVRHNDLISLRKKIEKLKNKHRRIWYLIDGVYSMYGDYAPFAELQQLLEEYDQLFLYTDDAHGMSWAGKNGCGYALSQVTLHQKMVLATSLNKAFASAGGVLVFPNAEWARRVKTCGGSMIFSGPIQPPMLGAAIASAKLHLSDAIVPLQKKLQENIAFLNENLTKKWLPLVAKNSSPIFFLAAGLPRVSFNIINRMMNEGFYLNTGAFPAVPMKKGGVRFTTTTHQSEEHMLSLVDALAYHYPKALDEEGSSIEEVFDEFKIDNKPHIKPYLVKPNNKHNSDLTLHYYQDIREVSHREWDQCFSNKGNFDWEGVHYLQNIFTNNDEKEHNWKFHFIIIKDTNNHIVLATFLTEALVKDDMFSDESVSLQIENERKLDPYFLTSKTLMMGSLATEGDHLFLDKRHPLSKKSVKELTNKINEIQNQSSINSVLLRDFEKIQNDDLREQFLEEGFSEIDMPDNNVIYDLTWDNDEDYINRLSKQAKAGLKRYVLRNKDQFITRYDKNVSQEIKDHCFQLYLNVQEKATQINTFSQPKKLIDHMFSHPNWDFIFLYLKDHLNENPRALPISVGICYRNGNTYNPLMMGLDYAYLKSHNHYKQMLYQMVMRAKNQEFKRLNFGFTANQAKSWVGAEPVRTTAYVQLNDHFNHEKLSNYTVKNTN